MKINIFWKYHFDMKIFGKCENISYFLNFKYLKVWVLVLKKFPAYFLPNTLFALDDPIMKMFFEGLSISAYTTYDIITFNLDF